MSSERRAPRNTDRGSTGDRAGSSKPGSSKPSSRNTVGRAGGRSAETSGDAEARMVQLGMYLGIAALAALFAVHAGSYFAYGAWRGYGRHHTSAETVLVFLALVGIVVGNVLSKQVAGPRLALLGTLLVLQAALAVGAWVSLWARDDWTAEAARAWMFGGAVASTGFVAAWFGLRRVRDAAGTSG